VALGVDSMDTRRLVSVTARTGEGAEERRYTVVHRDREHKHLVGECMYMRLGSRAKKTRGTPFLQRVVDELAAEKKFRVLSGDRVLDRLSVSMLTTIAGMNTAELDAYRKKVGTKLPSSRRVFQNEQIKNEFISANMEAGDVSTLIRTWITVIAGMFGWPISWFGFGDGSTRATAEAQQDPAVTDSNQMKTMFERFVERLLYFVVDQAILANRIDAVNTPNAGLTVTVKDGAKDGLVRARSIRDCVTINVSTIPLVESQPTTTPLAATATAADVVGKLLAMKGETGEETVSIDDVLAILNFAFATDGVGIELARDLVTE
jgi:hypothetical protein